MIYLLMLVLLIMLIVSFIINKKDILSPSFVFTFGFFFQSLWAVAFSKAWNLDLHLNTYLVISLGVLEFLFVSFMIKLLINKNHVKKQENFALSKINISTTREVVYLLFVLIIGALYLYNVVKSVGGSFSSIKSITDAISSFDGLVKFSNEFDKVKLPFIISNLNIAVVASGYWFLYVVINNFLCDKKVKIVEILIVIFSIICSTLGGSRTPAFMMIVAGIAYYIIIINKKKNFEKLFSRKIIRNTIIIGIIFLSSFILFANALGRNVKNNPAEYLSVYCGAEVKNLDLFLQEQNQIEKNKIFGSQTFFSLIKTVGNKFHLDDYHEYRLDLPFREVNGFQLGNVYTTFYAFIYDFGYIGMAILVLIMALISQLVYEFIIKLKDMNNPKLSVLAYGIIFGCLLLSFFSDKFYEEIFSAGFIKNILVWVLCTFLFCKLDFKKIIHKNK